MKKLCMKRKEKYQYLKNIGNRKYNSKKIFVYKWERMRDLLLTSRWEDRKISTQERRRRT